MIVLIVEEQLLAAVDVLFRENADAMIAKDAHDTRLTVWRQAVIGEAYFVALLKTSRFDLNETVSHLFRRITAIVSVQIKEE